MDDFFSFQHEESSANSGISTLKVAIQPSGDRQVSLVNAFTAGSLSGTCSTLLFQPFDLVKTCLQVEGTALSSTGWPKLGGSNAMLYSFYSVTGREALLRCVPGIGLYFSALRGLSQFTSEERTLGESVLLGASGRTIAGITLLLETIVKTRHESGFYSYNSMLDAVMPIWKREGGKGLYSGLLATAARDAPFSGFYLMFYTKIKRQAKNGLGTPELHAFETFICGSLAGVIASVVTQPADAVKTRLQLFPHKYSSTGSAVYCILKDADDVDYVCTHPEIVRVPDPEILLDNLVELKHHKLVRSIRRGTVSRELKPNAKTRDQLDQIVGYPSTKVLTSEEEDLVWQFQFYLTNQKKALTKFLKCVDWTQPQEARQAQELLEEWNPVDVEDALELLSSQFTNRAVRQYAVSRLKDANDDDLLLYLLQLVQALRYEALSDEEEKLTENTVDSLLQDNTESQTAETIPTRDAEGIAMVKDIEEGSDLASFLILRACRSDTLANYFYWYLFVECNKGKDTKAAEMFSNVMKRFSQALMKGGWECTVRQNMLGKQQQFVNHIVRLMKEVSQFRGGHNKKIHRLRDLLDVPELTSFEPIPLLLDPGIKIKGIIVGTPEDKKVWLFKSHLMPCKLTFLTLDDQEYVTIFKNGDDLRQDELILQIIRLMDKLLMKENLDLKLTPYKVLATSGSHGFVQFIESTPIAEILHKDEDRSILNYFRRHAPCESAPLGISPEVMDTYVKSCAGYCVITYILGVGDRHLDNLLLTKSGNLFHIDFGYILGEDPKPLPPPMKLNKEMVEGMGGASSEFYQTFRKQCFTAFLHLRRHANLILNLFSLMVDANIPHIALEPDKAVKKVQDKFRLDLSDEEAVQYLQSLIDESVTAMFPVVVEHIHKFAQYWRK